MTLIHDGSSQVIYCKPSVNYSTIAVSTRRSWVTNCVSNAHDIHAFTPFCQSK